jgi:hypothetical protein
MLSVSDELYSWTKDIVKCNSNYIPISDLILDSPSDVGKYMKEKKDNATELYLEHSQCMVT